jgi:hypothetical protein
MLGGCCEDHLGKEKGLVKVMILERMSTRREKKDEDKEFQCQ